jgi:hypothetical protein
MIFTPTASSIASHLLPNAYEDVGTAKVITESKIFDHIRDVHPQFEHAGVNKVVHTIAN